MNDHDTTAMEQQLSAMTEQEVAHLYSALEVDDPRVDIVAGELERRKIDL